MAHIKLPPPLGLRQRIEARRHRKRKGEVLQPERERDGSNLPNTVSLLCTNTHLFPPPRAANGKSKAPLELQ